MQSLKAQAQDLEDEMISLEVEREELQLAMFMLARAKYGETKLNPESREGQLHLLPDILCQPQRLQVLARRVEDHLQSLGAQAQNLEGEMQVCVADTQEHEPTQIVRTRAQFLKYMKYIEGDPRHTLEGCNVWMLRCRFWDRRCSRLYSRRNWAVRCKDRRTGPKR